MNRRDVATGLLAGLASVAAMAAVAAAGLALLLDTGRGAVPRLSAAAVGLAVGAPADVAVSGAVGADRLPGGVADRFSGGLPGLFSAGAAAAPSPGGMTVTAVGRAAGRPLGVLLPGAVVLFVAVLRRPTPGRAAGTVIGFLAGVAACAWSVRPVPMPVGPATLTVAPDRWGVVAGGLVCAIVLAGAGLVAGRAGPGWRRPIVAVAAAAGGLAALGTIGGTAAGALLAGPRGAAAGLLTGANVPLGALPWALGVPWRVTLDGPLGNTLRDRQPAGWDGSRPWWLILAAILLVALCGLMAAGRLPRDPTASRARAAVPSAVVGGVTFALLAAVTGVAASATVGVFVIRLPVLDASAHGDLPLAAAAGVLAGVVAWAASAGRAARRHRRVAPRARGKNLQ